MGIEPLRSGPWRSLRSFSIPLLLAFGLALLAGCEDAGGDTPVPATNQGDEIGLSTSLPIYWRENHDIADMLADERPPHWALAVLREHGTVTPLDTLAGANGAMPLGPRSLLVLAQPYPLSPEDNVALEGWVRNGGRVLLFADPMLTGESAFALGDRRRPQDVVLLSPILGRWGLVLRFDETQPTGEREIAGRGTRVPVNLAGSFALLPGDSGCTLEAGGLIASCRIGEGRILAVADAALLEERTGAQAESRAAVLRQLIGRLR